MPEENCLGGGGGERPWGIMEGEKVPLHKKNNGSKRGQNENPLRGKK